MLFQENSFLQQLLYLRIDRDLRDRSTVCWLCWTVVHKPEGWIDGRQGRVFVDDVVAHALMRSNGFLVEDIARAVDQDLNHLCLD